MPPSRLNPALGIALLLGAFAAAQDVKLNVTYVCEGERLYVESCNIRDLSDTSTCQVAHPDRPKHNGFMAYTSETRGTLKKLLPTCKPPTAEELAKAEAFKKRQQEIYDKAVAKANPQPVAAPTNASAPQPQSVGRPTPPKNAEERAMRRCVSAGRLPATCTGNSLLGWFGDIVSKVLPSAAKEPQPGPVMAGVFEGAGKWRLDFIDGGVLVNCNILSPNQENYNIAFKNNLAVLTIDTTPKPLVLTIRPDGTITGPGPVTINGVIASGYDSGYRDQSGRQISAAEATNSPTPVYDSAGNRVSRNGALPGHSTFSHKQVTCPALNLSSKGASVGVQTMQTDLLKSMFNDGDKGPPTPPGIRMHGIFAAASTGFSAQFFPESVILGCGPDSARAYPYTVAADGSKAAGIKVDAPDHPLAIAFSPNGGLDPGTGPYLVHGRMVVGNKDNGDFTFAPMEQTCDLAPLAPSKTIPMTGGTATPAAPGSSPTANGGGTLSTPSAPLGNATLSIVSGFPVGAQNPLAAHPYVLLRDSYANALAKGGVSVPAGDSPYKFAGIACGTRAPDCPKINEAIKASAASSVRADANGAGTFPGVPPGTYYLMIATRYNNQALVWGQAVQLKAGANSITLDQSNAVPVN
jgi:hypothetical protein